MKLFGMENGDYVWFDDDGIAISSNKSELLKLKLSDLGFEDEVQ